MQQLTVTYEAGLAQRTRSLREQVASGVYRRGLVSVAGKLDLAPSKLSEKLAGGDSSGRRRGLTLDELELYIAVTGDVSPIHYLVDKFLRDPTTAQREAMAEVLALIKQFPALISAAGLDDTPKGSR